MFHFAIASKCHTLSNALDISKKLHKLQDFHQKIIYAMSQCQTLDFSLLDCFQEKKEHSVFFSLTEAMLPFFYIDEKPPVSMRCLKTIFDGLQLISSQILNIRMLILL